MTNKTNIILINLTKSKLKLILEFCERENINFTFDKYYYSSEYYDVIAILDDIVIKNDNVPIIFKKLIEGEYTDYLEDNNEIEKLDKIKYDDPTKKI